MGAYFIYYLSTKLFSIDISFFLWQQTHDSAKSFNFSFDPIDLTFNLKCCDAFVSRLFGCENKKPIYLSSCFVAKDQKTSKAKKMVVIKIFYSESGISLCYLISIFVCF